MAKRRDVEAILNRLRGTLTEDRLRRGFRSFRQAEPTEEELEEFREELVSEAYNAGLTEWDDAFLDWD